MTGITYLKFNECGFLIEKDSECFPCLPYFTDMKTLKSSLDLLKEHIKKHKRFFVDERRDRVSYHALNYKIDSLIYIHIGLHRYVVSLEETDDYITPERDINYVYRLIDSFTSCLT
jgi:hypothetical protein